MTNFNPCVLVLVLAVGGAGEETENTELQGYWVAVAAESDGEAATKEQLDGAAIEIAGNRIRHEGSKMAMWIGDRPGKLIDTGDVWRKFTLNPNKVPKELNLATGWFGIQALHSSEYRGKEHETHWAIGFPTYDKSIYSLVNNDTLKICWGGDERPESFTTKAGDGLSLVVYKKTEKPKQDDQPECPEDMSIHCQSRRLPRCPP